MTKSQELKSVPEAIVACMKEVDGLVEKRQKLEKELNESVALMTIVPDAFDGGSAKVQWVSVYPHIYPCGFKMIVTKGNGEIVHVKLSETDASEETLDILRPARSRINVYENSFDPDSTESWNRALNIHARSNENE